MFLSRQFERFADRNGLDKAVLSQVVREVGAGLSLFDLGGGVFKKRIAREGGGKSGGFRSILICVHEGVVIFQFGFAKNDRDSIDRGERRALRGLAKIYAALSVMQLASSQQLVEWEFVP